MIKSSRLSPLSQRVGGGENRYKGFTEWTYECLTERRKKSRLGRLPTVIGIKGGKTLPNRVVPRRATSSSLRR